MKYYSEKLKQFFDTEQACAEAEKAHEKAVATAAAKKEALVKERANRAKEIDELYKKVQDAREAYDTALQKFIEDYGSDHRIYRFTRPYFSFFDWF